MTDDAESDDDDENGEVDYEDDSEIEEGEDDQELKTSNRSTFNPLGEKSVDTSTEDFEEWKSNLMKKLSSLDQFKKSSDIRRHIYGKEATTEATDEKENEEKKDMIAGIFQPKEKSTSSKTLNARDCSRSQMIKQELVDVVKISEAIRDCFVPRSWTSEDAQDMLDAANDDDDDDDEL
jgi:hypothetical protein